MTRGPFAPLRHPGVKLIWSGGVISDIGTWVQLVVVGSLVARTTGSALATGMTAMAMFTPQGLCAPLGGLMADRLDRRKVFMVALCGQGIVTSVLALLLYRGVTSTVTLSLAILCQSACGAFGQPSYAAMLPDLVPRDELLAMVSLGIASWNSGRVFGPIFGTLLDAGIGPAGAVAANAVTFFVLAAGVASVRRSFPPPKHSRQENFRQQLATGARALRATPGCRTAMAGIVLLNLTVGPFMGLIPIYARKVFHGGTPLTGAFSAMQGVGALTGAITVAMIAQRFGCWRIARVSGTMLVTAFFAYAIAPWSWLALIVIVFLGASVSLWFATMQGIAQRDAPTEQRGRILSLNQAAMGTAYGIGLLILGKVGDTFSLRWAFGGCAVVAAIVLTITARRRPDLPAIFDPIPAGAPATV